MFNHYIRWYSEQITMTFAPAEMIRVLFHLYSRPVYHDIRPIKSYLVKKKSAFVFFVFYPCLHQRDSYLYLLTHFVAGICLLQTPIFQQAATASLWLWKTIFFLTKIIIFGICLPFVNALFAPFGLSSFCCWEMVVCSWNTNRNFVAYNTLYEPSPLK